jgi:ubiquinone/menaquinone biosynthesis C-methylase UbiE
MSFVVNSDLRQDQEIDWDAYASQYDLLAKYNPAYSDNIALMRYLLSRYLVREPKRVLDIGAGTGNYICALGKDYPNASFVHLDADVVMNRIAEGKYRSAGIRNIDIVTSPVLDAELDRGGFDLIICINALYAMQSRDKVLSKVRNWLREDGSFFVIDFGRHTDIWDWSKYIFGHILRDLGVREFVRFLVKGSETIRQNRKGSKGQLEGIYWLHSTDEFKLALEASGFSVEHIETCYRDYCDLALCRSTSETDATTRISTRAPATAS